MFYYTGNSSINFYWKKKVISNREMTSLWHMAKVKSNWTPGRQARKKDFLLLSGLKDSISDPPPPGRAEVWSRDAAQFEPRLVHLLIVRYLVALHGFQSENPFRDLEMSPKNYTSGKSSIDKQMDEQAATCVKVALLPLPDRWFQWRCGPPLPAASLWCECCASGSLWCRRPPLKPIAGQRDMRFRWQMLCHATAGQPEPQYAVFSYELNYLLCASQYLQSSRAAAAGSDSADRRWTPARLADCWTSRRQSWGRLPDSETSGQSPDTHCQREKQRRENRSVHSSDEKW